jgi:hypothetical protein
VKLIDVQLRRNLRLAFSFRNMELVYWQVVDEVRSPTSNQVNIAVLEMSLR